MHIGIDVGGTNTDAVLMDATVTLAGVKKSTSPDVTTGIVDAIAALRTERDFDGDDIDAVMIGTTRVSAYTANNADGSASGTSMAGSALNRVALGSSTPYAPVRVAPSVASNA